MCEEDPYMYPAHQIAPQISLSTAKQLVDVLYGLRVKAIKEMDSYIDKNYMVEVEDHHCSNPHIETVSKDGYVLKVLNIIDSRRQHVDAEHEVCRLLKRHGVQCPVSELNIHGQEKSLERLPIETGQQNGKEHSSVHLVRLMHYIPGVMLFDVPYTPEILIQSGEQLGKIDHIIKDFDHPALDNHKLIWSLTCLPQLTSFLHAVKDPNKKKMVQDVISAFQEEVEPNYHNYRNAVIQGDYNQHNIIVSKPDENQNQAASSVKGVVDFGHVIKNYTVMEVAIAIAYHSIDSEVVGPVDTGGYFLAGYSRHMELNKAERQVLKVLVCGRICQSVVIGAHTYLQNPVNDYAIATGKRGWRVLDMIWNTPKQELYSRWQKTVDKVNTNVDQELI